MSKKIKKTRITVIFVDGTEASHLVYEINRYAIFANGVMSIPTDQKIPPGTDPTDVYFHEYNLVIYPLTKVSKVIFKREGEL